METAGPEQEREWRLQREVDLALLDPVAFRSRVIWLRRAGLFYLYSLLGLGVALIIGAVIGALLRPGAVVALGALAILGGLLCFFAYPGLPRTPPTLRGARLGPAEGPRLRAELSRAAQAQGTVPVDDLVIGFGAEAMVAYQPAAAPWKRGTATLQLGWALLAALPPDEFRAVVMHEMAHHGGAHGREYGELMRSWSRVEALKARVDAQPRAQWVLSGFLEWYEPRVRRAAFALRRLHEVEAYELAARATDPETMVTSLLRVTMLATRFADGLRRRKESGQLGESDLRLLLEESAPHALSEPVFRNVYGHVLSQRTDLSDEHLAVWDVITRWRLQDEVSLARLAGRLRHSPGTTAGDYYLEGARERVEKAVLAYATQELAAFRKRADSARPSLLQGAAEIVEIPDDERYPGDWEALVMLLLQSGLKPQAAQVAEDALRRFPDDPGILLAAGAARAETGSEGSRELLLAATASPVHAKEAAVALSDVLRREGDYSQAESVSAGVLANEKRDQALDNDVRLRTSPYDLFEAIALDEETRAVFTESLAPVKELQEAYLVWRTSRFYPGARSSVLLIWLQFGAQQALAKGKDPLEPLRAAMPPGIAHIPLVSVNGLAWRRTLDKLGDARLK